VPVVGETAEGACGRRWLRNGMRGRVAIQSSPEYCSTVYICGMEWRRRRDFRFLCFFATYLDVRSSGRLRSLIRVSQILFCDWLE
jgi:hypothetical protein